MASDAYKDAGVDIAAGEAVVDGIKGAVRSTFRPEVISELGGFGGLFALGSGYRDPVLVSGTDEGGRQMMWMNASERGTPVDEVLIQKY